MKDFLRSTFGAYLGFSNAASANLAVGSSGYALFTDGSKTVRVSVLAPEDDKVRSELAKSPLQKASGSGNPSSAPKDLSFTIPTLEQLNIFSLAYKNDAVSRADDLVEAAIVLRDHFRAEQQQLYDAYNQLASKVKLGNGNPFSSIELGTSLSSLPEPARSMAYDHVVGNWQSQGFSSEDEAKAFFQRGLVMSTASFLTLVGSTGDNRLSIFGIPNP
jgi:hypothetical protein